MAQFWARENLYIWSIEGNELKDVYIWLMFIAEGRKDGQQAAMILEKDLRLFQEVFVCFSN